MDINLASPDFKLEQYPILAQLRSEDPLHKLALPGNREGYLVTRYEDAELILKDQRFVKEVQHALSPAQIAEFYSWLIRPEEEQAANSDPSMNHHMLNTDPPDHTRLRALVNLSFTPRLVEQWRERIQNMTNELIDAVEPNGEMELINDIAFPLPITVITSMLGIPAEDHPRFRIWSTAVIESTGNPEAVQNAYGAIQEFRTYLQQTLRARRGQDRGDLLSKLVQAEMEGDKLSEDELIGMVFLLLVAGHETTVNLISNGMLALLLHPDQKEKLEQDPGLIKTAIEEFLRYQGPLQVATQRWAREDLELHGMHIRRGDYMVISLASANRDSEIFKDSDMLDITRKENRHLAFGKGIHYCLGAPLARMEGQIAINTLLARFPNLSLNIDPSELTWRPGATMMGLRALPLKF